MTITFLIDGYNLLHAMGLLGGNPVGPHGLEKARGRLLGLLYGSLAETAPSATVVFDAARALPAAMQDQDYKGIHIVYATGKEEADDVIERLIGRASAPKSLWVVSDDHRIQRAAKRRECQAKGCEEFLSWLERFRRHKDAAAAQAPEKQEKLTEGEAQRWLAEFGDIESDPSLKKAFERDDFEELP